jgi:hypothetical protein
MRHRDSSHTKISEEVNRSARIESGRSVAASRSTHPLTEFQRTLGNQSVLKLFRSRAGRAKLSFGETAEVCGEEADRIAENGARYPWPVHLGPLKGKEAERGLSPEEASKRNLSWHTHAAGDLGIQLKKIAVGSRELPTKEDLNFSIATLVGESSPVGPVVEKLGIAMVIKRRAESQWGGKITFKDVILGTGLYGNPSESVLARLAELYLNEEPGDLDEFKNLVDQAHSEQGMRSADRSYLKSRTGFRTFVQRIEQAKMAMEFVLEEAAFPPELGILAKEATWWGGEIDLWDASKCKIWKHGRRVMNHELVYVVHQEFGRTYFLKEASSIRDNKMREEEIERSKKFLCVEMVNKSGCIRETILKNNPECKDYLEGSAKTESPRPESEAPALRWGTDNRCAVRLSSGVHPADNEVPSDIEESIPAWKGGGQPLPPTVRSFFEPRFEHDFSGVKVHTDAKATEWARRLSALAFTVGPNVVFGEGQYAPDTEVGRRILAHELTHVVQQDREIRPRLQRFAAELDANKVYIRPEKGDTDADLDRVLCPGIKDRKIAGRKRIDVTACLPEGVVKALSLGPYNCADFVRQAFGGTPPKEALKVDWFDPVILWKELLKSGYRIRGFGVVKENGKVESAEGISWQQLHPRMGDLVFMNGGIRLMKGAKEPDPAGDKFTVNWDHVGFFIVRSRNGLDFHLAKDGDENPIGVYRTGSELAEGLAPGAYVKGIETLMAYLYKPEPEKKPGVAK